MPHKPGTQRLGAGCLWWRALSALSASSLDTVRHNARQRTAVQIAALPILAQRPGSYLAEVDGAVWVVDDARQELVSVSHRLNG